MFPTKPYKKATTLINQTGLPTPFQFGEPISTSKNLHIEMEPSEGILESKEEKTVGVSDDCKVEGSVSNH